MPFYLRNDEQLFAKARVHWITYIYPFIWFVAGIIIYHAAMSTHHYAWRWVGYLFIFPLIYRYISNKFKRFVVTNQRVYIKTGIIARNENEIPINKVNNVELREGFFQRLLGTANIVILTGNDQLIELEHISRPGEFKDAIAYAIE